MLPVANLHRLYDTTIEFFVSRSPSLSPSSHSPEQRLSPLVSPITDSVVSQSRERDHTCSCSAESSRLPSTSMRRELDDVKKELSCTKLELSKMEQRCRYLERSLKETREMLRIRDAELERARRTVPYPLMMESRSSSGAESIDSVMMVSAGWGDEMSHDERRAQQRSSEFFLNKTDGGWSGAQVLQAVHDINSEILQFCAMVTEDCRFEKSTPISPSKLIQATRDSASRIGQNLANMLSRRDHSQDPILVQLALQGCAVGCIRKALAAFCMGFPSKHDKVFSQIYSHIYVANPQPTSSRWRALTHLHMHSMYPYLEDYAANELASSIYRWSSDVLLISGNIADGLSSRDGLQARFGDQVKRIANSVCKLARLTREEIMSSNFDVVSVGHDEVYDQHSMMDVFGEYGTSQGIVLTTTELGLRCTTRRDTEEAKIDSRVLLQPRVILVDNVLDYI